MKFLATCIHVVCLGLAVGGSFACATDPDTGESVADWPKIEATLEETIVAIDGSIQVWSHNEEAVAKLTQLREAVVLVERGVEMYQATGTPTTLDEYLAAAITLVEELQGQVDPEDEDLVATLFTVRTGLGVVKIAIA